MWLECQNLIYYEVMIVFSLVVYHLTSNCLQGSLVGCSLYAEVQNTASTNHRENTDPYAYVITLEFFASNPQRPWRGGGMN